MSERKGTISVQTADIFPIIKKWLYSEHDIFLRELVANATDAITKRATEARIKNEEIPTGKIKIEINKTDKTLTISDNGLGMDEAEVEKYLAQLAFSGAEEFVNKIKDSGNETSADIIGKFGLGFYSAYMVANKVEVQSLSMKEGATATKWTCAGDPEYTFSDSTKSEVGTSIKLFLNEDGEEFLNEFKTTDTLKKFCNFLPYEISVLDVEKKVKPTKEDGSVDNDAAEIPATPTVINETEPLWKKDPKEITDEQYKEFFRKQYPMDGEPLFWIHLKVDHPFTLEGILYFPKLNPQKPIQERNIKLYARQVFVSDDVKNVIPDYLSLLKGVIDSSDIPLNVSRSSLQGDPNIRRISNYISKKVGEALKILNKKNRERYEEIWDDIGLFVKYGCISDPKFDEIMRDRVLFKNSDSKFMTLEQYKETIPSEYAEKMKDKVIYFEKDKSDNSLRNQLKEVSIQTIETDDHIDPHFMQHLETKQTEENKITFTCVDTAMQEIFTSENSTEEDMEVKDLFAKILLPEKTEDDQAPAQKDVEIQKISNSKTPAYFKVDEQMKRFEKMAKSMGQNFGSFPLKKTLVINPGNPLIQNALKIHKKGGNDELVSKICHHVEDLAAISSEGFSTEEKDSFIQRSQDLIQELTTFAL